MVAACTLTACSLLGDDARPAAPVAGAFSDGTVTVGVDDPLGEISPLIRGVAGPVAELDGAGITFDSWGGTRATRYNYQLGDAWNQAREGAFRNDGARSTDDVVRDRLFANEAASVVSRVAVPALGWVARDSDPETCSFPDPAGNGCLSVAEFDCRRAGPIADPRRANVGSSPATVAEWIGRLEDEGAEATYLAIDNEPERWGVDHYDVHPTCTDYLEILGTYVAYASALRDVSPRSLLTGPVMCCWFEHLDPPGPDESSDQDLLSWFLGGLSDRSVGDDPLIDVVDVHFRPLADVVNSRTDDGIDRDRVEAVRELWDPDHDVAGSSQAVEFIPRLRRTIDETFPDMPLMISDWRFGGESTPSGALAIANALGVFAREGVHAAAYAEGAIEQASPAHLAFAMYGNYDGRGGAFEGSALPAVVEGVEDLGAYAALERSTLRVVLVNSGDEELSVVLDLGDSWRTGSPSVWTYATDGDSEIIRSRASNSDDGTTVEIASGAIAVLEATVRAVETVGGPQDAAPGDDTVATMP